MNDKIFLSFGPFTITWYALFILTGVVVAYELSQRTMKKWKYSSSVLEDYGYDQLQIRKTFDKSGNDLVKAIKIIKLVVIIGMVITMFFISYFVIKLVLKSRNVYFSTLRILGANYRSTKKILDVELFVNSSVAYLTYILFIYFFASLNFSTWAELIKR